MYLNSSESIGNWGVLDGGIKEKSQEWTFGKQYNLTISGIHFKVKII